MTLIQSSPAKQARLAGMGFSEIIGRSIHRTELGCALIAVSAQGVCAILLGDERAVLEADFHRRFPNVAGSGLSADRDRLVDDVLAVIDAPAAPVTFPLDARGTPFRRRVWAALREIPPGETANYADIARRIGAPTAIRAVAGACAANPVAIAIPCHRVVRSDGALSGYRWGIERKRALLEKEGVRVAA